MRKSVVFLLVLALVLLPGCGRKAPSTPEYTLNPDGTIDRLRWGMTYAQAGRVVKSIREQHPDILWGDEPAVTELTVLLPVGVVQGRWAYIIQLTFRHLWQEGKRSPLRLVEIQMTFSPETELSALRAWAAEALSGMEQKTEWRLASPETLGDRVSREVLLEVYHGYSDEYLSRLPEEPLYSAAVTATEYQHTRLTTEGRGAALAEALEG